MSNSRYSLQNATTTLVLPENSDSGPTGKILNCDIGFIVSASELRYRVQATDRYGKPGGETWGDRQTSSRKFTLDYDISNPEPQPEIYYEDTLNEILEMFNPALFPCYLVDTINGRRAQVELERHQDQPADAGLDRRVGVGSFDLIWKEGLWENVDESSYSGATGGLVSGDTFTVDNDGRAKAYPIITLMAVDDVEEFTIRNVGTGIFTRIGNTGFTAGSQIVINSQNGSIRLNGVEISQSLAVGSGFVYLDPGSNIIEYTSTGGAVTLESLTYREKWPR